RRGDSLMRDLDEARGASDAFMVFRNHYWFPEVTFKPQGIELYRIYQEALGVGLLYQAVSEAVHELKEHYEGKADDLIGSLVFVLQLIAVLVLPAGFLTTMFQDELRAMLKGLLDAAGIAPVYVYLYVPAALAVSVVAILFALIRYLRDRSG